MTCIRRGDAADVPELTIIWRRSVEATHAFLAPEDVDMLEREVRQGLGTLELWIAVSDGVPVGFMAMNGNMIEALFIDPDHMGKKLGTAFIDHAKTLKGLPLRVDVNEDNPAAAAFYRARGFRQTGRSEKDGAGRPWPLLHLVMET